MKTATRDGLARLGGQMGIGSQEYAHREHLAYPVLMREGPETSRGSRRDRKTRTSDAEAPL